jgi:DNA-binding NarL/FixJ family response regulator
MITTVASSLRTQGAAIDAAIRAEPGARRLRPVHDGPSTAKGLGLVWVVTSFPLVAAGLEKFLEGKADVRIGANPFAGSPSCVVLYADGLKESFVDGMERVRALYPGVPLLVLGPRLDLELARVALNNGADGFVHAAMEREQMVKAVEIAQKGELAAPRELLHYLLSGSETPDLGDLSVRQREAVEMVAEGASNSEIAGRMYLSESTIKQHLRAAYKVLGVHNRVQAAKTMNRGRAH